MFAGNRAAATLRSLFSWTLSSFLFLIGSAEGASGCKGAANLVYEMDPATIVHNVVSAESGALCLMDVDIPMEGPDGLPLIRFYNSLNSEKADFGEGTRTNYPTRVSFVDRHDDHYHVWVEEPGGSTLQFTGRPANGELSLTLDPRAKSYGTVNTCGGEISGRTNLKNQRLTYQSSDPKWHKGGKKGALAMSLGSGETRFFRTRAEGALHSFQVVEEQKPNGNRRHYDYASDHYWKRIWSTDGSGRELRWLEFDDRNMGNHLTYRGSNGCSVEYFFSDHLFKKYRSTAIDRVVPSHAPEVRYKWRKPSPRSRSAWLTEICHPDDRFLRIEYNKEGRVAALHAPAGPAGETKKIYEFGYLKKKDWSRTSVVDSEGGRKRYHFDRWNRLTEIEFFDRGELVRTLFFRWCRSGVDIGNLVTKGVKNKDGEIVCCSTLEYDVHGNVTKETLHGDLTGEGAEPIVLDELWQPSPGRYDSYSKLARYSQDGRNLKVWEQEGDGPDVEYVYADGSDLLLARLLRSEGEIRKRTFFEYDDAGLLVESMIDDGSTTDRADLTDATQRTCTRYERQSDVNEMGYGKPLVEERFAIDLKTDERVLLDRRHYTYGVADRMLSMDRYDAEGEWRYRETYEYDEKGRLTQKSNALDELTEYAYDDNFNCVLSEKLGSGFRTEYRYDRQNRLIQQDEIHATGELYTNHYGYDSLGRKNREVDQYGETTLFQYDGLGRLTERIFPGVPDATGSLHFPSEKSIYDCSDQIILQTDRSGDQTAFTYNSRGQKSRVVYPDGTEERFRYTNNGNLVEKVARNGTTTRYEYDFLNRPTAVYTKGSNGQFLASEHHSYSTFHRITSSDPELTVTQYSYDYAGRKVQERVVAATGDAAVTSFRYDSLGRVRQTVRQISAAAALTETRCFDLLDREIAGYKEDGLAAYRYEYDVAGNRTLVSQERSEGQWDTTTTTYDGRGRPTAVVDAEGAQTRFFYSEVENDHGQRVLKKSSVDPLGNRTEEYLDAHGRVARVEKFDPFGTKVSERTYLYDGSGRKIQESHSVIATSTGEHLRDYLLEWVRGPGGRVECQIEGGTRPTHYSYNERGEQSEVQKPDGTSLYYSYDGLGHLTRIWSSDDSVDHSYMFNSKGEVIAWDGERRVLGLNGMVRREIREGGADFFAEYDGLGRRLLAMPSGSIRICYEYDALGIERVQLDELNVRSLPSYYRVTEKDRQGRPIVASLAGSAGEIRYSYNANGSLTGLSSDNYTQKLRYDEAGRLLEVSGDGAQTYAYDSLGQMVEERGSASNSYGYDSVQNRIIDGGMELTVSPVNLLKKGKGRTFSHDLNGNVIQIESSGEVVTLKYDALNRLIEVSRDGERVARYRYDALHRRREKVLAGGETIRYLYDGLREVGSESDGALRDFRLLMNQSGPERGVTLLAWVGKQRFVPVHNHRGDIVVLTDPVTGEKVGSTESSAFGVPGESTGVRSPWTFQGKRVDEETGFLLFGRRFYDPMEGRWISPDPAGFADGPNLYAYCQNNPVTAFDSFGLYTEDSPSVWSRVKSAVRRTFRSQSRARQENAQRPQVKHGPTLSQFGEASGSSPYNQTVGGGEINDRVRVGYTHGNDTTPDKALADAHWLSSVHGGVNVTATIYGTRGSATADLFQRSLPSLTYSKRQVGAPALAQKWKEQIRSMGGVGPNRHVIEYCHSNGNIVAYQALRNHMPREMRKMIQIHSLASPIAIPNRICGGATHYVNHFDPVTLPARFEAYFQPKRYSMQLVGEGGFRSLRNHNIRDSIYSETVRSLGRQFELEHGRVR